MSPPPRPRYSTDLTDADWARLGPVVPAWKLGGRPARDRREIINEISYVVQTGCAWRLLFHEFPPSQMVQTVGQGGYSWARNRHGQPRRSE